MAREIYLFIVEEKREKDLILYHILSLILTKTIKRREIFIRRINNNNNPSNMYM